MAYREVEKAPPKENEKDDYAFVVPAFPVFLLFAHLFSHAVKNKEWRLVLAVSKAIS